MPGGRRAREEGESRWPQRVSISRGCQWAIQCGGNFALSLSFSLSLIKSGGKSLDAAKSFRHGLESANEQVEVVGIYFLYFTLPSILSYLSYLRYLRYLRYSRLGLRIFAGLKKVLANVDKSKMMIQ